jgi:hypothetical protein
MDENFVEFYNSDNYLKGKAKEVNDDKKEEKGQTEEAKEDGSRSGEGM